ncbi:MAG: SpoIIIAH-like family protein [Ruminococcus sp.]|jgi:stage III sporulation protein AH|nr:SpoIIIAH-like family protein [Ruminococcus sp.]
MKKPTLIIGKKHIILACLTLILGIAIYVNYVFANPAVDNLVEDPTVAANTASDKTDDASANYGDTAFVMATNTANVTADPTANVTADPTATPNPAEFEDVDPTDYFSQVRLARMVSRDTAAEQLSSIIGGGDITTDEASTYTMAAVNLSALSEKETMIESLIIAQGFSECVVYLSDDTANIVVKSAGLLPAEAAQIKDILLGEVTIPAENIRIFEVR